MSKAPPRSRSGRSGEAKQTARAVPAAPSISEKDLQLLAAAPAPFDRPGWLFELKYDGFRVLALTHGGRAKLVSRQGNELGAAFPEIIGELAALPECAIDGELVVLDDQGLPQFDALAARSRKSKPSAIAAAARQTPAALLAFDLLVVGDTDLRKTPLIERKKQLSALVSPLRRIKAVDYLQGSGTGLFEAVRELGLEGIVAKRAASIYRRGRSSDWLKIKTALGKKKTEERGDSWYGGPGPKTRAKRAARDATSSAAGATGRTRANRPLSARHNQTAIHDTLNADSDSIAVAVDGEALSFSDLNKVLWPPVKASHLHEITKREYLAYLLEVSPYMLPHVADRPLTLFLYPQGIAGRRSVEMHWEVTPPSFMRTAQIYSTNKKHDHTYFLCNNAASLLWLANAGALELHTWHSRLDPEPDAHGASMNASGSLKSLERSLLNYPDYIFFDIDSYLYSGNEKKGAEPEYHRTGFEQCRKAALRLHDLLYELSLESLVKTSGKTGLHVVVPLVRSIDFSEAREISREIYMRLLAEAPQDFTMEWRVRSRTGKTFLDYGMNRRASSMAAPYTARAVPGGLISMPITWDELRHIEPPDFRVDTALAHLKATGDKWCDILDMKQNV